MRLSALRMLTGVGQGHRIWAIRYFLLCILSVSAFRATCGGEIKTESKKIDSANALSDKEIADFKSALAVQYPAYTKLSVAFTLKGKVSNEELYYEGELSANATDLRIQLKDAVFLSPLLSLNIGSEKVTMRDIAHNKTQSVARADYQWVELFGRMFPVRFFEPLMRGLLPADATAAGSSYEKTAAGEVLVRSDNNAFEAALYFKDARLQKIFYRDKTQGEIIIFHIGAPFNDRAYPRAIKIELARSNDYLALNFKALRIQGNVKKK